MHDSEYDVGTRQARLMDKDIDTAVVLAGGAGTRLRPLTNSTPKGMINISGKPLLEWVVEWLEGNGVKNVIFGVAYLKEKIMDYFGDGSQFGLDIDYSVHTVQGGTCEGFRLAIDRYVDREDFLAMNGDQIIDLEIPEVASLHLSKRPMATMVLTHPACPYGHVEINGMKEVSSFDEKPSCTMLCSTGIYIFNRAILEHIPLTGDIEKTTFPLLARKKALQAYIHDGLFVTINTEKDITSAEGILGKRGVWVV